MFNWPAKRPAVTGQGDYSHASALLPPTKDHFFAHNFCLYLHLARYFYQQQFARCFVSSIWYKYMYRRCLWNYHFRYFLIFCLFFVYHCTISHAVQLSVLTYVSIRLWLLIVLLWLSWGLNCLFVYWLSNFLTFPIIFRLNNANCFERRRRCECRINCELCARHHLNNWMFSVEIRGSLAKSLLHPSNKVQQIITFRKAFFKVFQFHFRESF